MKLGYVKIYRQLQDHWLYQEKPFCSMAAWVDLITRANHKSIKIRFDREVIALQRGQFITSTVKLAEQWGWSRTKVSNFLEILEKDGMIQKLSDRRKTTITVCNYTYWQEAPTTIEQVEHHHDATAELETHNSGTSLQQPEATDKNDNHDKQVNNENNDKNNNKDKKEKNIFCVEQHPLLLNKEEEKNPKAEADEETIWEERYQAIVDLFHDYLREDLHQVMKVTDKRKAAMKARWTYYYEKDRRCNPLYTFENLFKITSECDFLLGDSERGWKASFDWLLEEKNMKAVLSNKYAPYYC